MNRIKLNVFGEMVGVIHIFIQPKDQEFRLLIFLLIETARGYHSDDNSYLYVPKECGRIREFSILIGKQMKN